VDGKAIPLRFAYVLDVDNIEEIGLIPNGPQKYQVIVLSDKALPLSAVANRYAPLSERRSPTDFFQLKTKSAVDSIYGIAMKVDPKKSAPFQVQFFHPGQGTQFSIEGTEFPDRITGMKRQGNQLSGTMLLAKPQQTYAEKGPNQYQYRATFRAPIRTEPKVTAVLEGKAAQDSPLAQSIRTYLVAAKKGDFAALGSLTTASHQTYLKEPKFVEYIKSDDMGISPDKIKRIVVRGNRALAVIVTEAPSYTQVNLQLVQEKGAWKLYWP
jgi:hypothetical protein